MKLKIKPLREGVKLPVRANATDAGLDVFWNPDCKKDFDKNYNDRLNFKTTCEVWYGNLAHDNEELEFYAVIPPRENMLMRTGIAVEFPATHAMEVKNRSSMGSKRSLVVGAHLIDSSYRGEIFIDLHNIGNMDQLLQAGDKIAQLVIYPIETPEYELVDELSDTARGDGGFGSTGK